MTPQDLLAVARGLLSGPDEAHWRSAVSRAYYAAFHAAGDFLRSLRFRVPGDGSAHRYLSDRFQNAELAGWNSFGELLESLRRCRTSADYELKASYGEKWAEDVFRDVDEFFDLLDQLRSDPEVFTAVAAIRAYEVGRGQVTYFGP